MVSMVMFGLLVIVVFNFAIDPTPRMVAAVAPGILWVAFTFGGVLGLNRSFGLEKDRGNLHGLMLAPAGRDTIYFGKMLGNFVFMLTVEAIVYPAFAIIFQPAVVDSRTHTHRTASNIGDKRGRDGLQRHVGEHPVAGGYASGVVLSCDSSCDNRGGRIYRGAAGVERRYESSKMDNITRRIRRGISRDLSGGFWNDIRRVRQA